MEHTINDPETNQPDSALLITRCGDAILADAIATPTPKMLFSEFWHQGQLAVLFGKDGIGKSLLAVQMAEAITRGTPVNGFVTEAPAQKVLYFDFASSDRQFARRYERYSFSDNFIRVTLNPHHWELRKFGEQLVAAIEAAVQEHEAKVIIIDSLSVLKFFVNEIFLLSNLVRLKNTMGLSVLLLAGAKKTVPGRALSLAGMAANKMIAGVSDSVFAMGETLPEGDNRYLVHLKGNEAGRVYHQGNVIIGRNSATPAPGVLPGFEFMGYETEEEQLCRRPEGLDAWIVDMKIDMPGLSLGEIARQLDTNKMKVKRVLERYGALLPANGTLKPAVADTDPKTETAATIFSAPQAPVCQPEMPENTAVTPVTPIIKTQKSAIKNSNPETLITTPEKQLSYSQRLQKRLAQARTERMKSR